MARDQQGPRHKKKVAQPEHNKRDAAATTPSRTVLQASAPAFCPSTAPAAMSFQPAAMPVQPPPVQEPTRPTTPASSGSDQWPEQHNMANWPYRKDGGDDGESWPRGGGNGIARG
ncbi:hypothetical protein CC86DRAFT_385924 [Ophiobolus disseminans]|uniref:Uncharacterized protein n=1 Tax=Ophiobolus disseminans TaxID=1469910 RepID=A0A6A6ZMW8_9PLEO|nr:hypothetical protein CC86DRAFT_385924 [Ophiobolus disseminans]